MLPKNIKGQAIKAYLIFTIAIFVTGSIYYARFKKFPRAAPKTGTNTIMAASF
jgi:hypothetical protein